jgi:ribosomal protein S18 acetylase RimI-like enzyme
MSGRQQKENCAGKAPARRWQVRPAGASDVAALVALRRAMFESMGHHDEAALSAMGAACASYFAQALRRGEFWAWVAEAGGEIVGCGGLVIHTSPPTVHNLAGREGYIMNMYTRPAWRRQGIATAILRAILDYLYTQGVATVSLRATPDGCRLYERFGFQPSNEMRLHLEELWNGVVDPGSQGG